MKVSSRCHSFIAAFVVAIVSYLGSALAVFDLSRAAVPFDEENFRDRPVAIGPHPRTIFCKPTWEGVAYAGDEWPFLVYRPLCALWRKTQGFASPASER